MSSKTKNALRYLPSALVALVLTGSAAFKIMGDQIITDHYAHIGMLPFLKALGLAELFLLGLFLFPRTRVMGFLLFNAYLGGAIATELSHGNSFIAPLLILGCIYLAFGMRKPSVFRNMLFFSKEPTATI